MHVYMLKNLFSLALSVFSCLSMWVSLGMRSLGLRKGAFAETINTCVGLEKSFLNIN